MTLNKMIACTGLVLSTALSTPAVLDNAAYAAAPHSASQVTPGSQPNIILIFVDDMGFGDLGVTGNQFIKTPNIDDIANQGVLLTDFHASANICTPSRAGLLTGRYPVRAGLGIQVVYPKSTHGLKSEEITIAEILKTVGYKTAMFGKWHLGHHEGMWPTDQGFDTFFGIPFSHDLKPLPLMNGTETLDEKVELAALTKRLTDEAIQYINDADDTPFFIYLPYTAPHEPLLPEAEHLRTSSAGAYGDVVQELDHHIGRLMVSLKVKGIDDNTLVIFTSDNGPWWEGSAGEISGRKGGVKDGAFRVPFAARWPHGIQAGTTSDAMTMNIDLMPTLAKLAGAEIPRDRTIDGADILPVMQGSEKSPHEKLLFFNQGKLAAIRSERFRFLIETPYMTYRAPVAKFGKFLLFDMEMGAENYSVARDNMGVVTDMVSTWHQVHNSLEQIPQTYTGAPDLSFISKLKIPTWPGVKTGEEK